MPTKQLFAAEDLTGLLGRPITIEQADTAERIVWGWLAPILGTNRPDPIPDSVYSWAVELGAIAIENPSGLESYQLGAERLQFSAERRGEILSEAAAGGVPGGGTTPRGSFPTACGWPDPARGWSTT